MKDYIFSFILMVIAVLIALFVFQALSNPQNSPSSSEPLMEVLDEEGDVIATLGSVSGTGVLTDLIGTSAAHFYVATGTATTTSSTVRVGFETDQIDLTVWGVPSSTTSELRYQKEYSNDNTYWFSEDTKSVVSDGTVTHSSASTTDKFVMTGENVWSRNISVKDIATRYFRLKIFRGANSATAGNNFSVCVQATAKSK